MQDKILGSCSINKKRDSRNASALATIKLISSGGKVTPFTFNVPQITFYCHMVQPRSLFPVVVAGVISLYTPSPPQNPIASFYSFKNSSSGMTGGRIRKHCAHPGLCEDMKPFHGGLPKEMTFTQQVRVLWNHSDSFHSIRRHAHTRTL